MPDVDPREVDVADVYKGDIRAAVLERAGGSVRFRYLDSYLDAGGPPVASRLPLSPQPLVSAAGSLPPFFAGLLPEGVRLAALTRRVRTSADDMLSLLVAVGADCIGDVRVVPSGVEPAAATPLAVVDDWGSADFDELFAASVAVAGERLERAALPGVQEKVSAAMISFPVTGAAGSHIVKLTPSGYPRLVENEAFFMAFAADAGLPVAEVRVVEDRQGRPGLLVRRFDRLATPDGRLLRLAQEDACQFCDAYPADKYRLTVGRIAQAVTELADAPVVALRDLIRLVAFSYLIANGDLHAKNISLRRRPDGLVELAPAYDLLADLPYTGDPHLALKIDGRDLGLRRAMLVAFGERFGVRARAVHALLDRMCDVAPAWVERLDEIGLAEKATAHLRRTILARRKELGPD
ncbi:MAG: HipA domain-containing protein [Actinomycetota bacterium]|jgi:serine/threonine-protein kinase HipA